MRKNSKCFIIINILLISILIVPWDIDSYADNIDNGLENILTVRSNNDPRTAAFDWGEIEVISEPIPGNNFNIGHSGVPSIAVENDKIFIVWMDRTNYNNAGNDLDIFYRYFDSSKWSEIQVISEPIQGQNLNIEDSWDPKIAAENGNVYVVWYDLNNTNGAGLDEDIFYRCNLTGNGWEDIQVISEPVLGKNFNTQYSLDPEIDVKNGKIYVVWEDNNNTNGAGTDFDIFYRSNLTGFSWEDIQVISEPVQGQNLNKVSSLLPSIAAENGKIYVVWSDNNDTNYAGIDDDIFFRCNLTGSNWEPIEVISEPVLDNNFNTGISIEPAVTVDNGKIYVVWQDNNDTNDAGTDWDIFYRCNLTGSDWEDIQVISEPVLGRDLNIQNSMNPEIAVEYSKIYVVWKDYNGTNNAGLDADIFYKCNLTSLYWEPVQIISEPRADCDINIKISGLPDIAVNHGKNHIVWHDENNTNGAGTDVDIFYRYISLPIILGHPTVTPISGNTSTLFNFTVVYFQFDNKSPTEITVKIDDAENSMSEVDPSDINYVDGKEYFFDIKDLDIMLHNYQFFTSDGIDIFLTQPFKNPIVYNTPPIIKTEDNLTTFEDVYYKIDYEFEDIDIVNVGQPIYWNFSTNAIWLKFESVTAILNGTPTNDDVGEYWVNITINDTINYDFTNFTLTVINVNDAPNIITNDIKIAIEDELYEVIYEAIDIDTPQNNLVWSMDSNSSWLGFDQVTAKLTGIPGNDEVGDYWISLSVSDTEYINYSNFTLQVINVNDPPRIITKNNITAMEDEFYEIYYFAKDIDNASSQLTWSIATNAEWLTYNTDKSVINGTPTNDDIGEYWVNISVSDNEFIHFTNFTLTVVNTNDPPMIITEDKTNATLGELYSINYEAEDIDPPPITLSWSVNTNTSDWLTIDAYNGWLNGIPLEKDAGIYWVNVTVTDGEDGWDYHNFTLKVLKKPVQLNYAPQLFNTSMTPSEGDIKTEFTFSVHYYDEDSDMPFFIQMIIEDAAYNMKLKSGENASNGTYEYSITLSEGPHNYYFIAFDGLETVKTNNLTTPDIKNIAGVSTEEMSWYWLFLIVVIIIIIGVVIAILIMKKRKAIKLPTIQAEILRGPPEHIALPGATPTADIATLLSAQPIVSEQLPSPKVQVQSSDTISSETISTPSLAPTAIGTQYQLPKATLSKDQKLGLLEERFLRGEVSEETYKKLKARIEAQTGEDITKDESEEQPTISDKQQKSKSIEEPTKLETSFGSTTESKSIDKTSQQLLIEPELVIQQYPKQQESMLISPEQRQSPQGLYPTLKSKVEVQQHSNQVKQHPKYIKKDQSNEE